MYKMKSPHVENVSEDFDLSTENIKQVPIFCNRKSAKYFVKLRTKNEIQQYNKMCVGFGGQFIIHGAI